MASVSNSASALGEAIGHSIEKEINRNLRALSVQYDCSGVGEEEAESTIMTDLFGNSFNIDLRVIDRNGNPLALVESKYLRYKKHNRDKASWICVAHTNLMATYPTIRRSIAVLIGDWTEGSKNLMKSFDVSIIEIPFQTIVSILSEYNIEFRWAEKDRSISATSWKTYSSLSQGKKDAIAKKAVSTIRPELEDLVKNTLVENDSSEFSSTELRIKLSTGEILRFEKIEDIRKVIDGMDAKDAKMMAQKNSKKGTLGEFF